MKLNLLYFSATGTTQTIVKTIAENISDVCEEYNITMEKDRINKLDFEENQLLIVGVPVYGGRIPLFLEEYFENVKGNNTPVIIVAVYGNRHYDDALLELKDIFSNNGFIVKGGAAFIGEHSFTTEVATGRPDTNDLILAKEFGIKIKGKISATNNSEVSIPGTFPYKERKPFVPISPVTSALCDNCGLCSTNCPREAIDLKNCSVVDSNKCILCNSCVKICPVNLKIFENEGIRKTIQFLKDNFETIRREPEFFY